MTQRPQDVQATFAATLVDEWVRAGVQHAVVCPGSRSTPLALAVADRDELTVHVQQDERSGGYLALGIGLATGRPAIVVTTSGTAAAELHPAVVEAHQAGVPLLACTADRPPELQDVGGPQVIDQTHLFGRAVRWFTDPGVADARVADRWRPLAARAYAEATGSWPGPVHLNLPFREPLVGEPGPLPPARAIGPWTRLVNSAATEEAVDTSVPQLRQRPADATSSRAMSVAGEGPRLSARPASGQLSAAGLAGRRGVIVAGEGGGDGETVHRLAEALGWPVLAEPRASAWRPAPTLVPHLDAVLRSPRAAEALRPEVIVRLGPPPASRVVNEWLAASGADEIVVGGQAWSDPAGTAGVVVRGRTDDVIAAWLATLDAEPLPRPQGWLTAWQTAATAATRALDRSFGADSADSATDVGVAGVTEPRVARDLVAALPDGVWLVVSSSMPIRDVERYATPRDGVRIVANRGANGIDGVVSTAVGVAVGTGGPTAVLLGDVAFLHDSNGLLGAASRDIDLVCVVVDNDGGGIFSFLPQARTLPTDRFERLFGTPHGLDLPTLAAAYGVEAHAVGVDLASQVRVAFEKGGIHVLVARTDRNANVEVHRHLDDAVAAAVDQALPS
jgi:2-succinyl-5-enolpyruvyl-6-hydroxy-3-cyclohexene-1-carboxylate synthase